MNKKNVILNIVLIIINCIIIFCIANNRYVNRMPSVDINYNSIVGYTNIDNTSFPIYEETTNRISFLEDVYELYLGVGVPTVISAIVTIGLSFIINKFIVKQDLKIRQYVIFFLIVLLINIIIYSQGITIAV
jgi:hypothetical protein